MPPRPEMHELQPRLWFVTQIVGYTVEVYLVAGLTEKRGTFGETMTGRPGRCGPIYLEETLIGSEGLLEVLMHEAIHVIDDAFGLGLSEAKVRTLGLGLHQLLKDTLTLHTTGPLPLPYASQSAPAQSELNHPIEDILAQILVPNLGSL